MQIYYFSRTGKSKKIAQEIADKNSVSANKIDDGKNWDGVVNFIKAGAMAAKKETLTIECTKPNNAEEIVLVFPLWAGTFPPAVRSFLSNVDPKKVTPVILSGGSSLNSKEQDLFNKIYEIKGKNTNPPTELMQ